MTNTDPFWCYEHKCWMSQCDWLKHSWETSQTFKERQEQRAHPECPSCRCRPPRSGVV